MRRMKRRCRKKGKRGRAQERDGVEERGNVTERASEIEWTSRGYYYSYGMCGGRASKSRRMMPRRVVRLGYQMVTNIVQMQLYYCTSGAFRLHSSFLAIRSRFTELPRSSCSA